VDSGDVLLVTIHSNVRCVRLELHGQIEELLPCRGLSITDVTIRRARTVSVALDGGEERKENFKKVLWILLKPEGSPRAHRTTMYAPLMTVPGGTLSPNELIGDEDTAVCVCVQATRFQGLVVITRYQSLPLPPCKMSSPYVSPG
jgi:hypothetical protein